jgi:hypothetical protein
VTRLENLTARASRIVKRSPAIALLMMLVQCKHGEPPTWSGEADASVSREAEFDTLAGITPDASAAQADALVDAGASSADEADAGDPGALPQTNDKPDATTPEFSARMQLLWSAILHDDADIAIPVFFPLSAYSQTKAISNPERDWQHRLFAHFKRDIHALHVEVASTGVGMSARLIRVDLNDKHAHWIEPGDEGNKIGYYRVYGSQLIWSAEGKEHASPISSFISWRGVWYIVHLTGFK